MTKRNDDVELAIDQIAPSSKARRPVRGTLMDPTAALPGSVLQVREQRTKKDTASQGKLRQAYVSYVKALAAHNGDVPSALADVLNITHEEAERDQVELHERLLGATKGQPISQVMANLDLGPTARAVILAKFAHSNNPAVALKSVTLANDLDALNKASRQGGSFEDWIKMVMKE